ncbi:MAG TPA: methylmalonyl Co-A mutase-associated GTPase MeaB [Xanthobacteraceae bacterium]
MTSEGATHGGTGPEWQVLLSGLRQRDRRALSRFISLVEARAAGWQDAMHCLFAETGRARVVGVTGSLGTGKSTLTGRLAVEFIERGHAVAILAVDPSSPFSGGAILGDRIRMANLAPHGVFLRSMATRGAHGGLSRATRDAVRILDAFGFDRILIETVGAGQDEIDILRVADVTLVVSMPGQGDEVQAIKAGIMEIADVFVVNKSDCAGADQAVADIQAMLRVTKSGARGGAPAVVLKSVATTGSGVREVVEAIQSRLPRAEIRRSAPNEIVEEVVELVDGRLHDVFWNELGARQRLRERVSGRDDVDPYLLFGEFFPQDLVRALLAAARERRTSD